MRDLMTVFYAAIIVLLAVSASGESAATSALPPSSGNPSQHFDPTRGVLLQGAQGQEVAKMCAIYIRELKKFVKYKGSSFGGTYVSFQGVA